MMHTIIIVLSSLLGGFFYRCRGGFLGLKGSLTARLVYWNIPIAIAMSFIDWRLGWLAGVLSYIPLVRPFNHVPFQSSASLKDCLGMAAHGMFTILCAVAPFTVHTWHVLFVVPIGALNGALHFLAYKLDKVSSGISVKAFTIPLINYPVNAGQLATGGAEWSELFRGAPVGSALGIAFYLV